MILNTNFYVTCRLLILFNLLATFVVTNEVVFSPCKERSSQSKDVTIDISGCNAEHRCSLRRGQNTTISVSFTPMLASFKGIERVLTGKFASFQGKTFELPMLRPIDASNETRRMQDARLVSKLIIPKNRLRTTKVKKIKVKSSDRYLTKFTYMVPVTAAKGPVDMRLVLREKVEGEKTWKMNSGNLFVCAIIASKYE
ncbi:uncharacterized protein LOC141849608 [Brevipalpus obovatus]|uniref:uncharacterized protein LOC141849608 n=1 Tax=Brevipalpus obovatus TaxID=246614 RepID=UPI003D9E39D3